MRKEAASKGAAVSDENGFYPVLPVRTDEARDLSRVVPRGGGTALDVAQQVR